MMGRTGLRLRSTGAWHWAVLFLPLVLPRDALLPTIEQTRGTTQSERKELKCGWGEKVDSDNRMRRSMRPPTEANDR